MRWFRANRIFGGRLALFALAVQLALSFGHIHREDIFGYGTASATPSHRRPLVMRSRARPIASPGHPDDYCAICATIFLLSSSFVAAAPQLPLPVASEPVEHVASAVIVFIAPRRVPSNPADLRSRDLRSMLTFDVAVRSPATVAGVGTRHFSFHVKSPRQRKRPGCRLKPAHPATQRKRSDG